MSIVVNSNISSLIAQRSLLNNTSSLSKVYQRLSTGLKINSAQDDAAGLSISEKLKFQISGYEKAQNNVKDGQNVLQIADAGLESILNNLQRIRELSVQAANGIYSSTERNYILDEIKERLNDTNNVVKSTKFVETPLLDGSVDELRIQTGAGSDVSTNTIDITTAFNGHDLTVTGLGLSGVLTLSGGTWSSESARNYLENIDDALEIILSSRSKIGSIVNRMDNMLSNLASMKENITSSNSIIRDADIAVETAEMTKLQILQQSSSKVLSQVNQIPSLALQLLQS